MGPKQDPRDDSQLEQRDECDSEQRVVERCDHGEQGVGCEQGANLRGLRANGIRTRARLRREREENGSGEDSENDIQRRLPCAFLIQNAGSEIRVHYGFFTSSSLDSIIILAARSCVKADQPQFHSVSILFRIPLSRAR
jgi:hypothetical protein